MTKKIESPKSLVPAGRKPTPKSPTKPGTSVAIASGTLLPILRSELAVAKLVGSGGEVSREGSVTLITGRGYVTREMIVPAEEIYYDTASGTTADRVSLGEADKVAWRDPGSGYDCIMHRDTVGGFLSGFVGVPRDHPLWGWEHEAVPVDFGIEVHGGLSYSAICQDGPSPLRRLIREAHRICHVRADRPAAYEPLRQAGDHRVDDAHVWWFGFSCNQAYDVVPANTRGSGYLSAEVGGEYRDDGYVVREVTNLAAQLRAIAEGEPMPPRMGPPLPPIGLDPKRGGRR